MKKLFIPLLIGGIISFSGCSSDDNLEANSKGPLTIKFDHSFGDEDLSLNSSNSYNLLTSTEAGTEKATFSAVKYIISNIRLEKENGEVFSYEEDENYFIVDESDNNSLNVDLTNVPAGDYTKITFGVGVDQSKYPLEDNELISFWEDAQSKGMTWNWTAGYKFFVVEGEYTNDTISTPTSFLYHLGSHGVNLDNYREVSLNLTNFVRVNASASPSIHIISDIRKVFNGPNQMYIAEKEEIKVDAERAPKIRDNVNLIFSVDHIHN